ncbi:zinc finger protein on ecdysone puffs isoform X2 [Vanessa atalanta]|uniref:zinc finger protein on ecdysone puffs isoform X2 n=1 Tax=Vanessa atalanta TaxID=42275 RepID=UPI001FCE027C|nr:zinc finger protein on ecdysone puffs isoform X2 [Vanessa atalanta]
MSSRGRGYGGRGNYTGRGSSYRGSYRGSNSRGNYDGGRGGRGGGYSSYNNDSRYNSSSTNRYASSRDRIDDSYKKPYRSESSASYSNRDYGGRSGSPDRKRMRMESYVQGSSSDRRSHDGGHYGGSYGGRQESYGGERRSFAGEDRRRSPARDSYRKASGMGPPREPPRPTARPRAPRRSFRGRTLRSRASYRGAPRSRGSFSSRRFAERSLGYTRAFRSVKGRSSVKSKEDEASSTEEDWEAEEKEETVEEKKEVKSKSPKEVEASEGEGGDGGEDTDKEADAASDAAPSQPYVHLSCVHCKEKCATFAGYAKHLLSSKHRAAMSAVARRHKAQLLRMRVAQRGAQRELEAAAGAELATRTTFCLVCRLNHRTTRHAHNLTDTHRAMKRFLMPFCRICRVTFRSPMIYEHHICSIEHLKKKANQTARRLSPKAEGSGDEGMDVDLDNFMTLDSVGDVDEVEDEDSGGEKKEEASPKKPKVEINIGSEHIKKMEVWWCELCRVYLPRADTGSAEEAEALRRHCRLRIHLGRYVQHRDTRTLRRHAERIHRQLHQQKEDEKEAANDDTENKVKVEKTEPTIEKKSQENGAEVTNTSGNEDKLWADVDKDIGELLREVDPQGNEASDDEEDLGRYDKFRKSDKKSKAGEGEDTNPKADENINEKVNVEVKSSA